MTKITDKLTFPDNPDLQLWEPKEEDLYYIFEDGNIRARYQERFGLVEGSPLAIYLVVKTHFRNKMPDILKHINYFCTFHDPNNELFVSMLSVKYIIDQMPTLSLKLFRDLVIQRMVTDSFISNVKEMTISLYNTNVNEEEPERFKSTPKITNDQARQIVAFSFAIRLILPVCLHYSNINPAYSSKTGYIEVFRLIYESLLKRVERDDVEVFGSIYEFLETRAMRTTQSDKGTWLQKTQLQGLTPELYTEDLIQNVTLVKSLYKLDYTRSPVSFIDGISEQYARHFRQEKYRSKPHEISSEESSNDSDDFLSHAEMIEMSIYQIDETNLTLNDINTRKTIERLRDSFALTVTQEEIDFYSANCKLSQVALFLLQAFYARHFKSSHSVYTLQRTQAIEFLVYLKKFLQLKGMVILPQIATAKARPKFKDTAIRNAKFIERIEKSSVYQNILAKKYMYLSAVEEQLSPKERPVIIRRISTLLNFVYEFVDPDPTLNERLYTDEDIDRFTNEVLMFLSII